MNRTLPSITMPSITMPSITMIGFGEAGAILASDLAALGCPVTAFDILVQSNKHCAELFAKASASNVRLCESLEESTRGANIVISAVTAASAEVVAQACGDVLQKGQFYLDINSVSPNTKRRNASLVEASGADYVEAAVMAPVPPQRLKVPMLLGGLRASDLERQLQALGMNAKAVATEIGKASSIKMCRSVMIKGLEALALECLFAARRYEAEEAVLETLHASFPSLGFNASFPDYLISRMAEHGRRRAAEMREVASTLEEVGLSPVMARATAARQDALVDAMLEVGCTYNPSDPFSWRELADRLQSSSL